MWAGTKIALILPVTIVRVVVGTGYVVKEKTPVDVPRIARASVAEMGFVMRRKPAEIATKIVGIAKGLAAYPMTRLGAMIPR